MPNHAALLLPAKRADLLVADLPDVAPGPGEIAVRARAVAVNPFDRLIRTIGDLIAGYLVYPAVLGTDVAGEVVAVGAGVSRFRVGDRVLGHAAGLEKSRNNAAEGAFQEQVLLLAHMASPIPPDMPFEHAAALPLGLSTAACSGWPRRRPIRSRRARHCWSGAARPASAATRYSSLAPQGTRCSPPARPATSTMCVG